MYINHKSYVYIVLEHAYLANVLHNNCKIEDKYKTIEMRDAYLHGVFSTREIAEGVARRLRVQSLFDEPRGYISVLKKSIKGPSVSPLEFLLGQC